MPRGLVILLGTSAAVITGAGIHATAWLLGPVFLALMIVIAVSPIQAGLRKRGVPAWLATTALVLVIYGALLSMFLALIVSIGQLVGELPRYAGRANQLVSEVTAWLADNDVDTDELRTISQSLDLDRVVDVAGTVLNSVGAIASNIVFVFMLLLFLSIEATYTSQRLAEIETDRPGVASALVGFAVGTRRYLVVTTIFGLLVAVLDTVALIVLDIPLPLLWGLLAFITNYVPNIGFVLGLVPPALLGLLEGGWQLMVVVIVVYCVLNFVGQSLIQPRFIGGAVGLSTTVAFVALLFWAWLLGPLGAILAIPLTLLTKALLIDIDPKAKWADSLLGVRRRT
jgi:AI-2 transport protein TqsA